MNKPGVCRHCGCSEQNPCWPHREEVYWTDETRTVCRRYECEKAERARKARASIPAGAAVEGKKSSDEFAGMSEWAIRRELERRGWGVGAIRLELEKRRRAVARRRKRRAA